MIDSLIGMEKQQSPFERAVRGMDIPVCSIFRTGDSYSPVSFDECGDTVTTRDSEEVRKAFPETVRISEFKVLCARGVSKNVVKGKRVGVLFSGGPAPGGHNVIAGIKKILGDDNTLLGVKGGPKGLLEGRLFEISDTAVANIQNTGGFDFLGTDRTKIKTEEQFFQVKRTCRDHNLDAIVIIGGDDSNTNAAILAEYLVKNVHDDGRGVQVIGVPKTIDGDLQIENILPISFGFDTATKIYSELVGNILSDTLSSLKYWHFIKLMGRAASHVTLEVALQTKPAVALISEEIAARKLSLDNVINIVAEAVVKRSKKGMNYGVVVIPEGIIEFIPEMTSLIKELNEKVAENAEMMKSLETREKRHFLYTKLSAVNAQLMASLPDYIENMLVSDRDSHGNLNVSGIPTEQLIIDMVKMRVKELDPSVPFKTQHHFFGYEGRCGAPTRFDAAYTFNLGLVAGSLILDGKTSYMASITDLDKGGTPLAIPLAGLLNIEMRGGKREFVIEKALVKTDSEAFKFYKSRRQSWTDDDQFSSTGPRQMMGPSAMQMPISVALNRKYKTLDFALNGKKQVASKDE